MHQEVIVRLSGDKEYHVELARLEPMGMEDARRWLDEQFTALECEPLRASGKVLLADKVLVVAANAGRTLLSDAAWSQQFARAARAALERETVRIDIPSMAVTF